MISKELYLLRPDVIFFNHGSFGACPKPVFESYQAWQRALEAQPVEFIGRRLTELLRHARGVLASYLHVEPEHLVYVSNATTALNIIARALPLNPEDEILTTDQEYGAIDRTFRYIAQSHGLVYRPHPTSSDALELHTQFVEDFWSSVNEKTKVIMISHITSPTALILPVKEICHRAREAGIITIVDGAHAPGQIPLNLTEIGADFYTGNCHKWLSAPKGAAFLYARPEWHKCLDPLIVSWGWQAETRGDSLLIDHHEWQGSRDPSAFLAVPDAIEFQRQQGWHWVGQYCHDLARQFRQGVMEITGLPALTPDSSEWYAQMTSLPLPVQEKQGHTLRQRLYDEYRIEIPIMFWQNRSLMRISVQAYNTPDEVEQLLAALRVLLPTL